MRHGTTNWFAFSRKFSQQFYESSLRRLVSVHSTIETAFEADKYLKGLNLPIYLCVEDLDSEYKDRAIRLRCGDKRATVLFSHITGLAECVPTNQAEHVITSIIESVNSHNKDNPEADSSDFVVYAHIKTVGFDYSVLMQGDMYQGIERRWITTLTGEIIPEPHDPSDSWTTQPVEE